LERKRFQFLVVASKVFFEVAATAFQRDGIQHFSVKNISLSQLVIQKFH
jgi:hypothetical protein